MEIKETFNLRGEVLITGYDASKNESITFVDDKNLIVLNGREKLSDLLLTGVGTHIEKIIMGSGGTAPNNPTLPYAVEPSEVDVNIRIVPEVSDTYTFLTDASAKPTLKFILIIPETSFNNKGINEIALMLSDDTAFSIKRFATITKSSSLSLKIVWSIYL